jgi:cell division protein FtsI/penicillin-binding protein 2
MKPTRRKTAFDPSHVSLRRRAYFMAAVITGLSTVVSARLIQIQIRGHERYKKIAESSHRRTDHLEAPRGTIADRHGQPLAVDEPVQQIAVDLGYLRERKVLASVLAHIEKMKPATMMGAWDVNHLRERYVNHLAERMAPSVGIPANEISREILERFSENDNAEYIIARHLPVDEAIRLRTALEDSKLGDYKPLRGRIGAVVFRNTFVRRYPCSTPVLHLLGKFGELREKPTLGAHALSGLEKTWDRKLVGQNGRRVIDGLENELASFRGEVVPAIPGNTLRTTIDTGLIQLTLDEIDAKPTNPTELAVAAMKPNRVIMVLFEPSTMAVRAVVGRDYTGKGDTHQTWNDLIQYVYEPGSTAKLATVAAALTQGRVVPSSMIEIDPDGDGSHSDAEIKPITDEHSFASLSVEGILVHSSNIGCYKLARQIGLGRFKQYLLDLGFNQPSGVGFPFEERGHFPKDWNMQNLSRVSYGYAFSSTPAQMCNLLGCVLNEGKWQPLHVAEAWLDPAGRQISEIPRGTTRQPITAKAAKAVRQMLVQVVETGTAKLAHSHAFEIGGKTGTANKWNAKTKSYDKNRQVVSFLGYIADQTGPRLAGLCIIDEPRVSAELAYGGKLAAPLFRRVAERAMSYYEIAPAFRAGRPTPPEVSVR